MIFVKDTARQGGGRERQSTPLPAPCAQGWRCPLGCSVVLQTPVTKDHINHPLPACPHHCSATCPGRAAGGAQPFSEEGCFQHGVSRRYRGLAHTVERCAGKPGKEPGILGRAEGISRAKSGISRGQRWASLQEIRHPGAELSILEAEMGIPGAEQGILG